MQYPCKGFFANHQRLWQQSIITRTLEERNQQINNFIDIQREMVAEMREQGRRNERERERTNRLIDKLMDK